MKELNFKINKQPNGKNCILYAFANVLQDEELLEYVCYLDSDGGGDKNSVQSIAEHSGYDVHDIYFTRSNTDFLLDGDIIKDNIELADGSTIDCYVMLLIGVYGKNLNHEISAHYLIKDEKVIVFDSLRENALLFDSFRDVCYNYNIIELCVLGYGKEIAFMHEDEEHPFNLYMANKL